MELIAHRINTTQELKKIPEEYGVEIDLRDYNDRLILEHDPFKDGEEFEEYLKQYNHGMMILNIKSERIELRVAKLLKKYSIKEYMYLDSSFPMIYYMTEKGERNIALRYSELEGVDTILKMKGRVKWVWVDTFTKLPIDKRMSEFLVKEGFKLCLVSPDLLGRQEDIALYKDLICSQSIMINAVCAKLSNLDVWK